MNERWVRTFKLWARTEWFRTRIREAEGVIDEALSRFNRPYVAFSGGKDSTALMHMVLRRNPNVTVVYWDYGPYFIPRELYREILRIARECGARDLRVLTSPLYRKLGRKARNVLGRVFIGKVVPRLIGEGYDCAFIGLRAEEGVKRRLRTARFYEYDERGITNVFPLRNWTWKDVWAYIVTRKVPYLKSYYDKYSEVLGYGNTRFVTLFDPEFDKYGGSNVDGVLMWRFKNPET